MFKLTAHPQGYWDLCGVPLWIEWAIMMFITIHHVYIQDMILKLDSTVHTMLI
jgi:hypothetical protein